MPTLTAAAAHDADTWLAALTKRIPKRSRHALTGSQFFDLAASIDEQQREQFILEPLLRGDLPDFLRKLKPVELQYRFDNGKQVNTTIFVTPDYLAIGSRSDFIRIPMNYHTASLVAAQFGVILPTRKNVPSRSIASGTLGWASPALACLAVSTSDINATSEIQQNFSAEF